MIKVMIMLFAFLVMLSASLNAADTKISDLTAIAAAGLASDDEFAIVDTSATATKRITIAEMDNRYIVTTDLVDADVSSGAALTFAKMEDLTASKALVSDASGDVSASAVTATELGYVDGVTSAIQTQLDTKPTKIGATDALQALGMLKATYDFSVDGGAISSIDSGQTFPDNSIIKHCDVEILTAMVSSTGTGTIAVHAEGANDILAAVDADTLSGFNACIPTLTVATYVKTTAARKLYFDIATNALTAGKFVVNCMYTVSE